MKQTLTTSEITHLLQSDDNANWSYAGAYALAEYLEELEESTGEEMEFDRVAIRCDFAQWDSLQDWAKDYFSNWANDLEIEVGEDGEPEDSDDADEKIRQHIQDNGTLIEFNGGVIVSSF